MAKVRSAAPGPVERVLVDVDRYAGDVLAPGWFPADVPDGGSSAYHPSGRLSGRARLGWGVAEQRGAGSRPGRDGDIGRLVAGRYRLLEWLGAGGMSTVWRAADEVLHREVAVKQLRLSALDGAAARLARQRIEREARIAARLGHPKVVAIFDVLVEDGEPWLVLEYLPSRSLAAMLEELGSLAPQEAAQLGAQIAEGLAAAHRAGIAHRDVTPGNVLISAAGVAKLTDFGISHAVGEVTVTQTGAVIGTPAYLAPEVARGQEAGAAADVYSLGATLYAAVEGDPPFGRAGGNVLETLSRVGRGRVPAPHRAGPLAPILGRLMSPAPAARPTAAQAQELLAEVGRPASAARRGSRWPAVALVTVAAVAVIAAGTGLVVSLTPGDGGSAANRPPPGGATATGLDDPRTADPCSLLDTAALHRFGQPALDPDLGRFAQCIATVSLPGSAEVDVEAEFHPALPTDQTVPGAVQRRAGLTIGRSPPDANRCERTILLADRTKITIRATNYGEQVARVRFCDIAEVATMTAVGVLTGGGVRDRRAPPPESLSGADACGLLDAQALARVEGLDPAERTAGFGNWSCEWGDRDVPGRPAVASLFYRSAPPGLGPRARPEIIAGREGQVVPGGLDDSAQACLVQLVHRSFTGRTGETRVERLLVSVYGPQPTETLCQTATDLTAVAVATLPAPE